MGKRRRKAKLRRLLETVLIVLLVVILGAVSALWAVNEYQMELTLRGDSELVLEYGTQFQDPGAEARFWGTVLSQEVRDVPVRVEGTVDTSKIGVYILQYEATVTYQDLFWEKTEVRTASRTVYVVDTQKPTITLTFKEGSYTLPGLPYEEEGFTAFDDYDGDLTDRVEVIPGEKRITYRVTDSSGNSYEVTRVVVYKDPHAPDLELHGDKEITLTEGDTFEDPGCYAYDNVDGDITDKVKVSCSVDTAVPGVYTISYTATDAHGNTATVTRKVIVQEKPPKPEPEPEPEPEPPLPEIPDPPLPPNGRVIYLTFDDGPGPHTARLLDILDKYGVKATFFVMHTKYMDLLPRMAASGHTIAMHTYSHSYSGIYASDEAYLSDLKAIQDEIFAYTGQTANILRFPGGSSNTISRDTCWGIMTRMTAKVEEMGYRYFDWNVDSNDSGGAKTADWVFRNVVNGIGNRQNSIVLQHDVKGFSVDAVERIIQWGLASGYTFAALDLNSPECEHGVYN